MSDTYFKPWCNLATCTLHVTTGATCTLHACCNTRVPFTHSAMSNGSTNAQIEPGYQHTTFPSSCLSAVHDRQERQGVLLINYNGLRPGVHCYQLPLPWWCWTRRWNGANYHLYLPIQHYTLWGAYLHRFCRTCTLLFATSPHCILRRYYWWTDIPTTYRASQLSILNWAWVFRYVHIYRV